MKSIISLKSIKSIALTTKKVVVIDFYRLTVSVDINENVIMDNYRIIDWFSDICFYISTALVRPCRNRTGDRGAWLVWNLTVFLPFLHSSLVWNNLFQIKYMIDSKNVVGLEIAIGFEFIFWKPKKKLKAIFVRVRCRGERLELRAPVHYRAIVMAAVHTCVRFQQVFCSCYWQNLSKSWGHMLYRETQYFGTSNALISDNN